MKMKMKNFHENSKKIFQKIFEKSRGNIFHLFNLFNLFSFI